MTWPATQPALPRAAVKPADGVCQKAEQLVHAVEHRVTWKRRMQKSPQNE